MPPKSKKYVKYKKILLSKQLLLLFRSINGLSCFFSGGSFWERWNARLKTVKSTIQEFNSKLIAEEQAKIAELIVNHFYKTLAADPGRLVKRLQEIINTC